MAVKEMTTEDKLKALFHLQTIHSKLDEIHTLKGELPMEVSDLEDVIVGLQSRLGKVEAEIHEMEAAISNYRNGIKDAEALIVKYDKQMSSVKNNREYQALEKEIEMQKLEIQLAEKRIKEAHETIETKQKYLEESKELLSHRMEDLEEKKNELGRIIEETEKEADALLAEAEKQANTIDDRLVSAYDRIRKAYSNKLAVVKIDRDSCGGCFATIPPQRQLEISQRKKVIVCEHCGRILVDAAIDMENE